MEDEKMCGIYKITNLVNGKVYIGQTNDIERRWKEHERTFKNNDEVLYRAMRKHGFENFSFEILMLCEEDLLDLMEIYYIKMYNSYIYAENSNGYNMTKGGEGIRGKKHSKKFKKFLSEIHTGKTHSEETKKKISESLKGENNPFYGKHHTEETKQKLREKNTGKTHSEETKKKMSESRKGKKMSEKNKIKLIEAIKGKPKSEEHKKKLSESHKGKIISEETKQRMSESHKGKNGWCSPYSKRIFCDGLIFPCIRECAEFYDKKPPTMAKWLRGTNNMPKEFVELGLRYATEEDILTYPIYKNIK